MNENDWQLILEALGFDSTAFELINERKQLQEKMNVGFYDAKLVVFRNHGLKALRELVARINILEDKVRELEDIIKGVKNGR